MSRMSMNRVSAVALVIVMAAGVPVAGTAAETALERALASGARSLTAAEIAARFEGHTGTWVDASGEKTVRVYYGPDNDLHGQLVGGGWAGTGLYGVAEDGRICISWDGMDDGRLRCLDVLRVDGRITKYNADGSLNGTYEGFEAGRTF